MAGPRPALWQAPSMRNALVFLGLGLLPGCRDDCSDELRIAIELHLTIPSGVKVERVTAELTREEECTFFRTLSGPVYTCYEQGGGDYLVRIYSDGEEIESEVVGVEADECHVEAATIAYVEVTATP